MNQARACGSRRSLRSRRIRPETTLSQRFAAATSLTTGATFSGTTTTQATFTLTLVPEPGAAGVVALAAGLVLRRRRA